MYVPAEWEAHQAVWLAWPFDKELWEDDLGPAQAEFLRFAQEILDVDQHGQARGETLKVLVPDSSSQAFVESQINHPGLQCFVEEYGDIWLRDTAPLFGKGECRAFTFNGWGKKYFFESDGDLSKRIAKLSSLSFSQSTLVAEGGAFEWDGAGQVLSTKNCLLHRERNPGMSLAEIEAELAVFGAKKLILLEAELENDHTDGHIDTLARFVSPSRILVMKPETKEDPNYEVLMELIRQLKFQKSLENKDFEIVYAPSAGRVENSKGNILPASYLNFYLSNTKVIVPQYGSDFDQMAVSQISKYFPNRKTVGLASQAILTGGGAFHCISQQEPKFV